MNVDPVDGSSYRSAFEAAGGLNCAQPGAQDVDMVAIKRLRAKVHKDTEEFIQTLRDSDPSYEEKFGSSSCGRTGLVEVLQEDCLYVAQNQVASRKHVLLLNMASSKAPGGGVRGGAGAQEEDLCRRTDLLPYLEAASRTLYPLAPGAGILSKCVRVLKAGEEGG